MLVVTINKIQNQSPVNDKKGAQRLENGIRRTSTLNHARVLQEELAFAGERIVLKSTSNQEKSQTTSRINKNTLENCFECA